MKSNVVLIGMPGSGKTSAGSLLAERLGYGFIDTDEFIEKMCNKKIKEIFIDGEDRFREIERSAVAEISMNTKTVIATGGGVIKNTENMDNLKRNGIIIFIDRPADFIISDINKDNRPLLSNNNDILALYKERYDLYIKYSDFKIINDSTIKSLLDKIMLKLRGELK